MKEKGLFLLPSGRRFYESSPGFRQPVKADTWPGITDSKKKGTDVHTLVQPGPHA